MGLPAYQPEFDSIECGGCGIVFYVPSKWRRDRVQNKGGYHCPNGCSRIYCGKTDEEKLREELTRQQSATAQATQKMWEAQAAQRKAEASLERHKKRANAGVCPHCQRTVSQMARHIKTKHPELTR